MSLDEALGFPYGRPLSEVSPLRYRSARRTRRHSQGYLLEVFPEHPASSGGLVLQHRLVAELVLGRYLSGVEVVHHEDENPRNNEPSNLWLFPSQAEHRAHHCAKARAPLEAPLRAMASDPTVSQADAALRLGASLSMVRECLARFRIQWPSAAQSALSEGSVREALRGRTTLEAAELLGVNHQTLRNRFPELLQKRASPGFLEGRKREIRSLAKRLRGDELAARLGCHPETLRRSIRRWAQEEPDAWSSVVDFQQSRRGLGRPPRRTA